MYNKEIAKNIASVIISQLGGYGKLKAMINARDLIFGMNEEKNYYLNFKFSGSKKYNYCKITLNFMDLYNIKFYKMRKKDFLMVESNTKKINDLYNDMLINTFEENTELYLSF